jgi:hypothetical protein
VSISAYDPLTYSKVERSFANADAVPSFIILADDHGYAIRLSCGDASSDSSDVSKNADTDDDSPLTIHLVCPSTSDPQIRLPCLHSVTGGGNKRYGMGDGRRAKRHLAGSAGTGGEGREFQDGGARYAEVPPEHMQRCYTGILFSNFSFTFFPPGYAASATRLK